MGDPPPDNSDIHLILFSFPCFKCLLFPLFLIKKAQVEAKKEHEGAVRLLEVSAGPSPAGFRGGRGRSCFHTSRKWGALMGACCAPATGTAHPPLCLSAQRPHREGKACPRSHTAHHGAGDLPHDPLSPPGSSGGHARRRKLRSHRGMRRKRGCGWSIPMGALPGG